MLLLHSILLRVLKRIGFFVDKAPDHSPPPIEPFSLSICDGRFRMVMAYRDGNSVVLHGYYMGVLSAIVVSVFNQEWVLRLGDPILPPDPRLRSLENLTIITEHGWMDVRLKSFTKPPISVVGCAELHFWESVIPCTQGTDGLLNLLQGCMVGNYRFLV